MASAFAAMKQGPSPPARPPARPLPLIIFHGGRDAIVAPANAAGLIDHALAAASPDRRTATLPATVTRGQVPGGRAYTRTCYQDPRGRGPGRALDHPPGRPCHGQAWSGGIPHGSYTDPRGPDASAELIRFFDEHPAVPPMP